MKIKRRPEEFVVTEKIDISPSDKGRYSLYILEKRGANTIDVIRDIARRVCVDFGSIKYGGLKDRHACTKQHITLSKYIPEGLVGKNYTLKFIGKTDEPMGREHVLGNHFEILVRDLSIETNILEKSINEVLKFGIPNYFGEQRFGSARHRKGFVAKEIVHKNFKRALYLLLVESSPWDDKKTKRFKKSVYDNWRKNLALSADLAPTHWERSIVKFLSDRKISKSVARSALQMVDSEFILLLCQAYQSFLWNEVLKNIILKLNVKYYKVPYIAGEYYFYNSIPNHKRDILWNLKIPLLSPKIELEGIVRDAYHEVLEKEGIPSVKEFKTNVKGAIFKTVQRKAIIIPEGLNYLIEEDDIYHGRKKVKLSFFLPSGSYATVVLKRIFEQGVDNLEEL